MIAVLGALREEVAALRKRMVAMETVSEPACTILRGTWQEREVLLVQTGMGRERAQAATRLILERYPVETLVSLGFAGALAEELHPGDVVLYSSVHCAEDDAGSYAANDEVLTRAMGALQDAAVVSSLGSGLTLQQVVLSPKEKGELADSFHVDVVDMESYWIAEIASEKHIPFVIIRSVSDTIHEKLLPFGRMMNDDGKLLWKATAAHFIRRPHHLAVIGRLYRNARLAKRNLAAAVDALIREL